MKGYAYAVVWIALNDEPTCKDVYQVASFISVQLIADLFKKDVKDVAADVVGFRTGTAPRRLVRQVNKHWFDLRKLLP